MIPCLYTETETAFTTNGIGKLCDALSCYVTEKRNGSYELKMTYSASGLHAEDLVEGNIILAKPSERATFQPFRIYKITTPLSGILEVAARHIQYQENFITVSPFSLHHGFSVLGSRKSGSNGSAEKPYDNRLPIFFLDRYRLTGHVHDHKSGDGARMPRWHGRLHAGHLRRRI